MGNCIHCLETEQLLLSCSLLSEKFEFLSSIAEEASDGKFIYEIINDAFDIFNDKVKDKEKLYNEIATSNKKLYKLKLQTDEYKNGWADLREELKSKNRFFPDKEIYINLFSKNAEKASSFPMLLEQLEKLIDKKTLFYRGRISDNALRNKDMGSPPNEMASPGRANPKGISYLYFSDNIDTCISEIRPYNNCDIYVSHLNVKCDKKLIDLRSPRKNISPLLYEETEFEEILSIIELLEIISQELSLPIKPHLSEFDYIPTQFFCEFIKSLKYDGIIYKSSFNKGNNYVLFSSANFVIKNPKHYKIIDMTYEYKEQKTKKPPMIETTK